ncbi:F390 synthetase-related protein [Paenibacillus eucommiae]|uniref:Adenylate-forming enzyme n=1 Tax=Paenibacillus eucommiae TaxID=1355755 RepID=A0ABS4J061_9BACL|nr:F390 synthetase-related protein [Paenibacillus eucommiae]MBP1993228.1 putative adenylate-forming enzyme [Paenibacillus eucommiae]
MWTDNLRIMYQYGLTRHGRRFRSREELGRWQERRLLHHLEKVRKGSPFYKELWGSRPVTDWRDFPMIDKSLMMAHFDQLNTAGIRKEDAFALALEAERTREFTPQIGGMTIGLSSGTSGNRGLFLISPAERMAWAGAILAKVLPGSLFARHSIAFFLRANSNLYGTVGSRRLRFEFYDLLDSMEQHLSCLNEQKPSLLVAPPSMLRLLAEQQRQGRLRIHPERILSVAEVLDPLDKRYVEEAFGQPVHQVYQCTEGLLAATCSHGTLHLNEDIVYIQKEYVDHSLRKFVPIITDFSRYAQPIVRYRLNDLLTEREQACSCGSPFTAIEMIEGRCDDVYYFPAVSGSQWIPVFPDFISRAIIAASGEVEAYHAVLHAADRLEISLQVKADERAGAQTAIAGALEVLCARVGCRMPRLEFTSYQPQVSGGRKLRRVESRAGR